MATADITLAWVKPPLQARSQQTLERLLDAAESILATKGLEHVTVAEIAKQAGSSVGAFYSRFADKEALLRCVLTRFTDQAVATAEAVLTPERWDGIAVQDALETMVVFMLAVLRERRQLILALMTRAATDAQLSAYSERLHETITEQMHGLLVYRGHDIRHPDPDTAIHLAVWLVLSAMESRALHSIETDPARPRLSDEVVAREIAEMVIRYVGIENAHVCQPTRQEVASQGL